MFVGVTFLQIVSSRGGALGGDCGDGFLGAWLQFEGDTALQSHLGEEVLGVGLAAVIVAWEPFSLFINCLLSASAPLASGF